mmetsp:Transcript_40949/g.49695  ORF Transcript_40949/g.49695 Transcript_40949/m.49695 type:complete len:793 (-) Transcript_40949:484-2862(-)|eukprot:CAMPEP_0197851200 /NCGR_PEP_ID=MMETSP1438-20131217/17511_1 /TAXON_ID=1461541 /ORGANISM="Pterosperma sp., Strain CCMP1384" /LENGTH=792 /DNA_ID=CAMNT_0043464721 /DNA_START=346 /DNA_END=2724 /DNA_ORIENTATION=-
MTGGSKKPFAHSERKRREAKGHKRKHFETGLAASQVDHGGPTAAQARQLVADLRAARESGCHADIRDLAHRLAELAKTEEEKPGTVDIIVNGGGLEAMIDLVHASVPVEAEESGDDVLKEVCNAVVQLAVNEVYAQRIGDSKFLASLVSLLKKPVASGVIAGRCVTEPSTSALSAARTAAEAIMSLAHNYPMIKDKVRAEGGIKPLVKLLECQQNVKVQKAAASALKTLAFRNEPNKKQMVEFKALRQLIFLLKSEDQNVHPEAVAVIGNLVHSTMEIKKQVLDEGVLQPVIDLLSSDCKDSQREAALLLGQFAAVPQPIEPPPGNNGNPTAASDEVKDFYKVRIVQRGAVRPLIELLGSEDPQVPEMAAFALGRLAQNTDNQAGIAQQGALKPLLALLDSGNDNVQHNAAFALYGLAENEDNVASIIREGGVRRLKAGEGLQRQQSKDCVAKTVSRLESKMENENVLKHLLYLLYASNDIDTRQYVATALAQLCNSKQIRKFTIRENDPDEHNTALEDVLFDIMQNKNACKSTQRDAVSAMCEFIAKASPENATRPSSPPASEEDRAYIPANYLNNPTQSDVTFMVEDKPFYAHRIVLLASACEYFRPMFDGEYKEKKLSSIVIPNIRYEVFQAMMKCIYTGSVEVSPEIAPELLKAADQYLLEGLKHLCENVIGPGLTVTNLMSVYELAEDFHAGSLMNACCHFALKNYDKMMEASAIDKYAGVEGYFGTEGSGVEAYAAIMTRMHKNTQEFIRQVVQGKVVLENEIESNEVKEESEAAAATGAPAETSG